jgi:hypothetical protein
MKRNTHPTRLITTPDEEHRQNFDAFSARVKKQRLDKIEKILAIPSPSDGFRVWLIKVLWRLDRNSQRRARVMSSRADLKAELRKSAKLAERLRASAEIVWMAGDPSVNEALQEFTRAQILDSSQLHSSGVGWIGVLDEFANRTLLLSDTLADDGGGPRRDVAFDDLLLALANYYRVLVQDHQRPILEEQFFAFAATVTDLARGLAIKVPPNDKALRERLRRVTARSLSDRT